jgi:hypothetical protein
MQKRNGNELLKYFYNDSLSPKRSLSGYEFTAGFADRTTGTAGVSTVGSNVSYTQAMADAGTWMRFGLNATQQVSNDYQYWTTPELSSPEGMGLFGGDLLPFAMDRLFDFDETAINAANAVGDTQWLASEGAMCFEGSRVGDLSISRFDFNALPQTANSSLEVALLWNTRDEDGNITFTAPLSGPTAFFGVGTVGITYLQRPLLTAYFASDEDRNALALPAIRCNTPIEIQPLTLLSSIIR